MGGRTTCLLPALFLLVIPGSSAISGPGAVRGVEQGSLTVWCQYDPGYEPYVKWWCRGADWSSCCFVVKTIHGSEKEVKKGRVSIKDNWENRSFTMTVEKLRVDDSDTYWCGIERVGADLGDDVDVTIDPGKTMCVCGRVSSGPTLSRDPTVPQRECPRGGGVLRAHGAPADHLGWEGPGFPSTLSWLQGRLRVGSGFPSSLFPCAVSARVCSRADEGGGPRVSLWTKGPSSVGPGDPDSCQCFPGTPALLGVFLLFLEFGVGSSELPCPPPVPYPISGGNPSPVGNAVLNVRV
ncbi:CMRF35-like molecule 5 isoform X1 [Ovis aries]|uniref:CMRF35-like molecule 5 isoform X1 n=1 Tax=Ovis aries TaxID=9940 RepID=UPI001C2E8572|nr:CMRF35-like molecule 5 isoform X1 [Ovis aries]